jgi:hypothetical protein
MLSAGSFESPEGVPRCPERFMERELRGVLMAITDSFLRVLRRALMACRTNIVAFHGLPGRRSTRPLLLLSVVTFALPMSPADGADTVVYANDFEAKLGSSFPEWSSSPITHASRARPPKTGTIEPQRVTNVESPRGKRRFLGEFGGPRIDPTARTSVQQAVLLALKGLPRHTEATVSFDLLILRSWDGSSPQYGPDRWWLKLEGGPTLIDTTFSNNPKLGTDRSYQDYPRRASVPFSGAATAKTMGYGFFGDSIYQLSFTFPHKADSLTLEFASDLFEGKGTQDESWGLDNVKVSVSTGKEREPAAGRGNVGKDTGGTVEKNR